MHCPSKSLFCGGDELGEDTGEEDEGVFREAAVEGTPVKLLLDTGSARMLVRRELVPEGKVLAGRVVAVQCAHGECIRYPVADIDVEVGGRKLTVRAGVADKLPVPVLLGRDIPELLELLTTREHRELVAVTTRSQSCRVAEPSTRSSGEQVLPKVVGEPVGDDSENIPGVYFADDLFEGGREQCQLTRSQKRAARRDYAKSDAERWGTLSISQDELRREQQEDKTLSAARRVAAGTNDITAGEGFFYRNELLYRQWKGSKDNVVVEQSVLHAREMPTHSSVRCSRDSPRGPFG